MSREGGTFTDDASHEEILLLMTFHYCFFSTIDKFNVILILLQYVSSQKFTIYANVHIKTSFPNLLGQKRWNNAVLIYGVTQCQPIMCASKVICNIYISKFN